MTAVWSSHHDDSTREVLLRSMLVTGDGPPSFGPIEFVTTHHGVDSTHWGTPVISRMKDGTLLAWSDSVHGIMAGYRRFGSNPADWWFQGVAYTPIDSMVPGAYFPGSFPSLASFGHVTDSNGLVWIAWQQPQLDTINPLPRVWIVVSVVRYAGIAVPPMRAPDVIDVAQDDFWTNLHPSIDQAQDTTELRAMVTWEIVGTGCPGPYDSWIAVRPVTTTIDTAGIPGPLIGFETAEMYLHSNTALGDSAFPNIACLNQTFGRAPDADTNVFSVVAQNEYGAMWNMKVPFDSARLDGIYSFAFGGRYPNASAAPFFHEEREATAYQSRYGVPGSTHDRLRTSRQFFAKAGRPTDYLADGRRLVVRLSDSMNTAISVSLEDAWYATDSVGVPLRMVERGGGMRRIDSIDHARALLRTSWFSVPDSAAVGFTTNGWFLGDATPAAAANVTAVVELIDSITSGVVHRLDSFVVSSSSGAHRCIVDTVVDLVAGTYCLRLRVDTANVIVPWDSARSRYPVIELTVPAATGTSAKRSRVSTATSRTARLSVRPNPFSDDAEIRYAVAAEAPIRLLLFDARGTLIRTLVEARTAGAGQYALTLRSEGLAGGTYLLVLEAGDERLVKTLVLTP